MSSKNKVTKDPKKQAAERKAYEKYMDKLKQGILKNSDGTSSSGSNSSINSSSSSSSSSTNSSSISSSSSSTNASGSSSTNASSSSSSFVHIYGIAATAVLPLGVCIFIIPKLMTNLQKAGTQPDKGPEKISKIRRKML